MKILPQFLQLPLEFNLRKFRKDLEPELLELERLIPSGGRAIDIGANNGLYTYKLSQICDYVEAFEPQPVCADIIAAYKRYFHRNITVHECALSNFNGTASLHIPVLQGRLRRTLATGIASLNEQDKVCDNLSVPVRKLDDYQFSEVVFIKIDVEGHEKQVLNGAKETILREKQILLIEIEQRHLNGFGKLFSKWKTRRH
jgi:FkbM family methyltransferase